MFVTFYTNTFIIIDVYSNGKIIFLELDIKFTANAMAITNLDPKKLSKLTVKISLGHPYDNRLYIKDGNLAGKVSFIVQIIKQYMLAKYNCCPKIIGNSGL